MKNLTQLILGILIIAFASHAQATPVTLQNATSTESERNDYLVSETIDGDFSSGLGHGWSPGPETISSPAVAVWETTEDIVDVSLLTIDLYFLFDYVPYHFPRRIRLSVTNDDRSEFADGLQHDGDVSANWVELSHLSFSGPDGITYTDNGDNSYSIGGTIPQTGIITVQASSIIAGVTGLRFEALPDAPTNTNGYAGNYDFVLTEIEVDAAPAIPNPPTLTLLLSGVFLTFVFRAKNLIK